jgi:hypothetical protein
MLLVFDDRDDLGQTRQREEVVGNGRPWLWYGSGSCSGTG